PTPPSPWRREWGASRPLLTLRSHIGWPAPTKTDTAAAHGNPLGVDEVRATKEILGLPPEEDFWVPQGVLDWYRNRARERGEAAHKTWRERANAWTGDKGEYQACIEGRGLTGWQEK